MPNSLPIERISLGGGELELLGWHYAAHLPDNRPHRHTFYEVCLVGEYGQGIYSVAGQSYPIGPGDLFIARPGFVHQIVNTAPPLMELLWLDFAWRAPASEEHTARDLDGTGALFRALESSSVWVARDVGAVDAIWRTLLAIGNAPTNGASRLQLQSLAIALVVGIAQAGAGELAPPAAGLSTNATSSAERLVQTAIRFIHDNLSSPLNVTLLADQLCISPRQCSRLFHDHLFTSPAAYIANLRLEQAAKMLRHSGHCVKEIAAEVGIPDPAHFTRRFTDRFGLAPVQYRNASTVEEPASGSTIFVPNIQDHDGFVQ